MSNICRCPVRGQAMVRRVKISFISTSVANKKSKILKTVSVPRAFP